MKIHEMADEKRKYSSLLGKLRLVCVLGDFGRHVFFTKKNVVNFLNTQSTPFQTEKYHTFYKMVRKNHRQIH